MAINTGVNTSKLVGYALLAAPIGVDASKIVGYATLANPIGVDASKIVAYAVLDVASAATLGSTVFYSAPTLKGKDGSAQNPVMSAFIVQDKGPKLSKSYGFLPWNFQVAANIASSTLIPIGTLGSISIVALPVLTVAAGEINTTGSGQLFPTGY
jgi:hypothetical protein